MKYLILACFFTAAAVFGIPYRCDQLSLNVIVNSTANTSFILQLSDFDGKTYISYSNLSYSDDGDDDGIDFLCFAFNQTIHCASNETEYIQVTGNQTLYLWGHFWNHNTTIPIQDLWPIFGTVVDESSFSMNTGEIFTPEKPCSADLDDLGLGNGTQCCTSFIPIKNPAVIFSYCKAFKSRTSIYNSDDNFSIYATALIDYQLTNESLNFEAIFDAPSDISVEYDYNDNWICYGNKNEVSRNCSIPIPSPNSKIFVEMTTRNGSDTDFYVPIARLLLRNEQALIEEGVSFTPSNNCQYTSGNLNSHQVTSSQFCCTEFE